MNSNDAESSLEDSSVYGEVSDDEDEESSEHEEEENHNVDESDEEEDTLLRPTAMIDAQLGQSQQSSRSVFGRTGNSIFNQTGERKLNSGRKVGKRGKKKIEKPLQELLAKANEAYLSEEFDNAIRYCEAIVKSNATVIEPYHILSNIFYTRGELEKELKALEAANGLESTINYENLIRVGELGLLLGKDDEHDGLIHGEIALGDIADRQKEDFKDKKKRRFLEISSKALLKVVKNQPDPSNATQLMLLRGEVLERMFEYKRATDIYKRLQKDLTDIRQIDLTVIYRLSRVYGIRKQFGRCATLVESHMNCVMHPLPEDIGLIQGHVLQSIQARNVLKDEQRRKAVARLKRKRASSKNLMSVEDEGMALENRVMVGNDDEGDYGSEESDSEDEEEDHNMLISKISEQLDSGIKILTMHLEFSIKEGTPYAKISRWIERNLEFSNVGLCAEPKLNQWLFWDEVKKLPTVDLVLMLALSYVKEQKIQEARAKLGEVESVLTSHPAVFENKKVLLYYFKVADAFAENGMYFQALTTFENMMEVPTLASMNLAIDVYSRAAFCCERIDHEHQPVYAAKTAGPKAVQYLEKVLDIVAHVPDPSKYIDTQNQTSHRLANLHAKFGNSDQTRGMSGLSNKRDREVQESHQFPPPPLYTMHETIVQSKQRRKLTNIRHIYNSVISDELRNIIEETHEFFEESDYYNCVRKSIPAFRKFFKEDEFELFCLSCVHANVDHYDDDRVLVLESDDVMQLFEESCTSLVVLGKPELAHELLEKVSTFRTSVKDSQRSKFLLLSIRMGLLAGNFKEGTKNLFNVARQLRDDAVAKQEEEWGDGVNSLWEILGAMLTTMSLSPKDHHPKDIQRRMDRLANSSSNTGSPVGLNMLLAHQYVMCQNSIRALATYFQIREQKKTPNPLVSLCIASAYMRIFPSKANVHKNITALKVWAFLDEYKQARSSSSGLSAAEIEYECHYNFGRVAEQLGIPVLAYTYYSKALEVEGLENKQKRHAALNMVRHFTSIGNLEGAKTLTAMYLTI